MLYRTVQTHLATWLEFSRDTRQGGSAPPHVEREFRRYLECGIRARCAECCYDFLIAFSCKDGQVLFRPIVDVNDDAAAGVDSVVRHSIKFCSWPDPLAAAVEPMSVQDGHASALFVLGRDQISRLRGSASVGYAAQLRDLTSFANFSVDTGANAEKIREFLKSCER